MRALREGRAESLVHVGLTGALCVLQRDQEAGLMRRIIVIVDAAPGIHIDGAVRRYRKLPRMPNIVGKNRRAESVGQAQPGIASGTFLLFGRCRAGASTSQRE